MGTLATDPKVLAFEAATIDPSTFDHRAHLYVAWCYLRELSPEEALLRYVTHLRALTAALGAPEKFHRTMTWAYLALVDDAMRRHPGAGFDALVELEPSLLERGGAPLLRHYDRAQLESEDARRRFVLPRRR